MKQLRRVIYLTLIAPAVLCGCGRVELEPLCILHTNDVHGHISPERVPGWKERLGGAAVTAGCIREIRERNREEGIPTLLLDAGDIFMGTPEGNVSEGVAMTEIMNEAGYDAVAVGNHEFDHGVAALAALTETAAFPFLGANIFDSTTGLIPKFIQPYTVEDYGSLTVGVIGLITPSTPAIVMPGKTGMIRFKEPDETVRDCMPLLKERGVDFVVVLSHLGLEADQELAREVDGIGLIVGGHSHTRLSKPLRISFNGTLICQAGSYGKYLGELDLLVNPETGRVDSYSYELIPLTKGRCPPDPGVEAIVEKWRGKAGEQFDEVIGYSRTDFESSDSGESPLGDLITDSMRRATGARIAFHNSYGIRNDLLKGKITYRDTYKVMPFDNTLYTMKLTGGQVREILEQALSLRNGILAFSGLRVDWDPAAPPGRKILRVACGGEPLRDGELYSVVTNSYLAHGGDYYETFLKGRNIVNTGILDREALNELIRSRSPISAEDFRPSRLIAVPASLSRRREGD